MNWKITVFLLTAVLFSGCSSSQKEELAGPRIEEMAWGPIRVQIEADPARIEVHRDVLLTIRIAAPVTMDISLPALDDRFEGFSVSGSFDREPVTEGNQIQRQTQLRLTPVIAERYRIAPIPISYTDRSVSPPINGWFPTKAIVLETTALVEGSPGDDIQAVLDPVWIHPSFKTVAFWVLLACLGLALLYALWKVLSRVREEVTLRRMSPRERALRELKRLLAKDLVTRHLVKEFYVELTMIVRRYIERRHSVRAPEQTTEEFLMAIRKDTRFSPEVLDRLRVFLEAADMVKFAGQAPGADAIDHAITTAQDYIESDSAQDTADDQLKIDN